MDFELSLRAKDYRQRLTAFMEEQVYPNEQRFLDEVQRDRWTAPHVIEELKAKARTDGLWNLFLPEDENGAGLTNLEYAPLAEIMGRSAMAPEVFNCSAPDTGNMEVLARYGTAEQKERWLRPLLAGQIRSCFAMTEPAVASSDATNIEASIVREDREYVINGRKWWCTGAGDPRCKLVIFLGKTDPSAPRHQQPFPSRRSDAEDRVGLQTVSRRALRRAQCFARSRIGRDRIARPERRGCGFPELLVSGRERSRRESVVRFRRLLWAGQHH